MGQGAYPNQRKSCHQLQAEYADLLRNGDQSTSVAASHIQPGFIGRAEKRSRRPHVGFLFRCTANPLKASRNE